jgi:AraC family transcriptional regulator
LLAIAKTIWMIESRFGMPVSLDDLAEHAALSRAHLSRRFAEATGVTISAYTRGRRLSEAAKALAAGAPDILAVALDVGYGSHEAFTRAFRDQFGETPEAVRQVGNLAGLALVDPLPMDLAVAAELGPPRIEQRPRMRVAGLLERHDLSRGNLIPAQWQRFTPYIGNIDGAVGRATYGLVGLSDGPFCDYLCGVEVGDSADIPPELAIAELPPARIARLGHRGHITSIRSTIEAVYREWLPGSGEVQTDPSRFLEYYGSDFNNRTGLGTVEVWIALRG